MKRKISKLVLIFIILFGMVNTVFAEENNNIVDAWIITHFDSDHGGVALRTIKEMEDILQI